MGVDFRFLQKFWFLRWCQWSDSPRQIGIPWRLCPRWTNTSYRHRPVVVQRAVVHLDSAGPDEQVTAPIEALHWAPQIAWETLEVFIPVLRAMSFKVPDIKELIEFPRHKQTNPHFRHSIRA